MSISQKRASEIVDALRRGTVPRTSLDAFCVGLERFEPAVDADLDAVAAGRGVFKAVRGDYGCGKTFFTRWLADRARKRGFVTSEVQISETETPLHKLETVYRRLMERLATADTPEGALRNVVDGWFHVLEEDVLGRARSSSSCDDHTTSPLLLPLFLTNPNKNKKIVEKVPIIKTLSYPHPIHSQI
jgi:hypothetical protein